jgi:hypothetical protein
MSELRTFGRAKTTLGEDSSEQQQNLGTTGWLRSLAIQTDEDDIDFQGRVAPPRSVQCDRCDFLCRCLLSSGARFDGYPSATSALAWQLL